MKKLLPVLITAFLMYGLPSFSQQDDKPPKGYLAITFGPSLSVGAFGDNNWDNDSSGFAKNGYNYTILEFGFKFIPNFGLAAAIKGAVVPLDVQALADGYAQEYGGQFTVKSTRWGYTGFFVGPFVSIPTKYVDIDFKFATGLMVAVAPDMTVSRDGETAGQQSSAGPSLAFNGGMAARIHVSKRIGIFTGAEYHISRPTFQTEFYDTSNYTETVTTAQRITMFNFSFGVALRIF